MKADHLTLMQKHHEEVTRFDPRDPNERITHKIAEFNKIILESSSIQVMIVTIFGPYQVGKSSLIKLLTQDAEIVHGDGTQEQTNGATLYGPYQYNEIRSRFGLPVVQKNMVIYFIDTEGIGGRRVGKNPTLNRLILTEILSPYVALSQVSIVMHESNIQNWSAEFIKEFFTTAASLVDDKNSLTLLDVVPGQAFYSKPNGVEIPIVEQYRNTSKMCAQTIPPKFNGLPVSKFIPLYNYMESDGPLEQPPYFYEYFKYAALDIIESIEVARTANIYDAQAIVQQFKYINENIKKQDFSKLIQTERKEAQFGTLERIYLPNVKRIVDSKKCEIKQLFPTITPSSSDEERLMTKTLSIDPIVAGIRTELEKFDIPPNIKEESIERFLVYAKTELSQPFDSENVKYLKLLQERQIQYLASVATTTINTVSSRAMITLMDSDKTTVDSVKVNACMDQIINESNKVVDANVKKYSISDETKRLVIDSIQEARNQMLTKLTEVAQKVAADNAQKEKEDKRRRMEQIRDLIFGIGSSLVSLLFEKVPSLVNNSQPQYDYHRGIRYEPRHDSTDDSE